MAVSNSSANWNGTVSSDKLISLIRDTTYEYFFDLASREYLMSCEPIIIKTVASDGNSATIAFPADPSIESSYYYPNRTNRIIASGEKAYLEHKVDNQSQGWIVGNNYIPNIVIPVMPVVSTGTITLLVSDSTEDIWFSGNVKQYGKIVVINVSVYNLENVFTQSTASLKLFKISGVSLPQISIDTSIVLGYFSANDNVSTGYLDTTGVFTAKNVFLAAGRTAVPSVYVSITYIVD